MARCYHLRCFATTVLNTMQLQDDPNSHITAELVQEGKDILQRAKDSGYGSDLLPPQYFVEFSDWMIKIYSGYTPPANYQPCEIQ